MMINNLSNNSTSYKRAEYTFSPQNKIAFKGMRSLTEWYKDNSYSAFNPPVNKTVKLKGPKAEKIGMGEGVVQTAKGFWGGGAAFSKLVLENPIKSAAFFAGMFGVCRLFPLVGITSLAAGSLMVLGFEALHLKSATKNVFNTIKNGNEEKHDKARIDLYKLGLNLFSLAVVTPFVPLAINQLKIQSKLNPALGFNKTVWNKIKEQKGILKKLNQLFLKTNNYDAFEADATLLAGHKNLNGILSWSKKVTEGASTTDHYWKATWNVIKNTWKDMLFKPDGHRFINLSDSAKGAVK